MKQHERSLNIYLKEIGKKKILSREEEVQLFKDLENGKDGTREKIVDANLRFVIKIALEFSRNGLAFSDIIQEGNIGLLEVIDKFDYTKGYRFSTYAAFWIRQSIQRAMRKSGNMIRIPVRKCRTIGKVDSAITNFMHYNGRSPTTTELSSIVKMNEEKLEKVLRIRESVLSLDAGGDDGNSFNLLDTIACNSRKSPREETIDRQIRQKISHLLTYLDPRERKIIKLRFGFQSGEPLSLRKASKIVGLSQEGVRRIEHKALRKLQRSSVRKTVEGLL